MSPGAYLKQFPAMLDDWRKSWGGKDLPFYTVEIAPFPYPTDKDKAYIAAFFLGKIKESCPVRWRR